ncbi:MAG: hypothetical protein ACT6Q8_16090 [Niveispirillum sp.]|uniref:hypothetical protein n=1 Tax=Niveispirillum sp. TaxID=1917217 RepID=UPI004035D81A
MDATAFRQKLPRFAACLLTIGGLGFLPPALADSPNINFNGDVFKIGPIKLSESFGVFLDTCPKISKTYWSELEDIDVTFRDNSKRDKSDPVGSDLEMVVNVKVKDKANIPDGPSYGSVKGKILSYQAFGGKTPGLFIENNVSAFMCDQKPAPAGKKAFLINEAFRVLDKQ